MKNRRLALAMAFAMTVTSLPVNGLTGYAAEEFSEIGPVTEAGAADGETVLDEAEVITEDHGEAEASGAGASGEDRSGVPDDAHGATAQNMEASDVVPFVESVEVVEQSDEGEDTYTLEIADSTWNRMYQLIEYGEDVELEVDASSTVSDTLQYEWKKCVWNSEGYWETEEKVLSSTKTLLVKNVTEKCVYNCEISDGTSKNNLMFTIEVNKGLQVGAYPAIKVRQGESVTLEARARTNSEKGLSYQWQTIQRHEDGSEDQNDITGAKDKTYTVENVQEPCVYRCNVSDGYSTSAIYFIIEIGEDDADSDDDEDWWESKSALTGESVILETGTRHAEFRYEWYTSETRDAEESEYTSLNYDFSYLYVTAGAGSDYYHCKRIATTEDGEKVKWYHFSVHGHELLNDNTDMDVYVNRGDSATLEMKFRAGEGKTIYYQWYKVEDGQEQKLDGATNSTLEITNVQKNAQYMCTVSTGDSGDTCSVVVNVWAISGITIDEENTQLEHEVLPGEDVTLEVFASTNEGELSYQWMREVADEEFASTEEIAGATSSSYTVENVQKRERYSCIVSNDNGEEETVDFQIEVDSGLELKSTVEVPVVVGKSAMLHQEAATTYGKLTYQWESLEQEDGIPYYAAIEGATEASCEIENPKLNAAGQYRCYVSDGYNYGFTYYTLYADTGLTPGVEEKTVMVNYGETATLQVDETVNVGSLEYQWYKVDEDSGDILLSNEKNASHYTTQEAITSAKDADSDYYYMCIVKDDYGNEKKIHFNIYVNSGLTATAEQEIVWVPDGEDATFKINASSDYEPLEYQWYVMDWYGIHELMGGTNTDTCTRSDVQEVVQYFCRVKDGVGTYTELIPVIAAPESLKGVETPSIDKARTYQIRPESAADNAAVILQPGGSAYFKLIPDRSGTWLFWPETEWMGGECGLSMEIYDSAQNLIASYYPFLNIQKTRVKAELEKEKTYYIRCTYNEKAVADNAKKAGSFWLWADYKGTQNHNWDTGSVVKEPTCTESGKIIYTCQDTGCGITYSAPLPATGAHQMTTIIDQAATCGAAGSQHRECSVCHTKEASTTIPATGAHQMTTVVDRAATCGAAGSQHQECSVCHTKEASTTIPATGAHQMMTIIDQAATCGAAGSQHQECSICHTKQVTSMIPPTGAHQYGAYHVTKQATIFAAGDEVKTCSVCGASEHRSIPQKQGTITLTATKLPLQVKKSVALSKIVTGLAAGDSIASCVSSNPNVATVDNSGKVTGKKAGTAVITITLASGVPAKVTVTVQKKAVATSKITNVEKSLKLNIGDKKTLQPVLSPITTTDKVSYTSSNKKVATVTKGGVILAKKSGTANITVKAGKKKVTVKVTVAKKVPTGMNGVPATKTLKAKKSFTIKPKLTPSGAEAKITYKSSNSKVATVNAKGKVTAKKAGTAVITVKADGVVRTCTVTVK